MVTKMQIGFFKVVLKAVLYNTASVVLLWAAHFKGFIRCESLQGKAVMFELVSLVRLLNGSGNMFMLYESSVILDSVLC